jgi:hypothetical protein
MGKGYIARGHRPTASGRSYESIDPKSTRRHGRSISAGSPGRVVWLANTDISDADWNNFFLLGIASKITGESSQELPAQRHRICSGTDEAVVVEVDSTVETAAARRDGGAGPRVALSPTSGL